jgi:nucleoside-diphosphate-sugar epimerase
LGRATIAVLINSGVDASQIKCFGSTKKSFHVEGIKFVSNPFSSVFSLKKVDCFLHLAFRTRDKVLGDNFNDYVSTNREITKHAMEFVEASKPRSVVTISSGAVFDGPHYEQLANEIDRNPYGVLKLEEEDGLIKVCNAVGANLVVNRLWGLSGRDIQNVAPYALAEFIQKAKQGEPIHIRSNKEVWRRYVDARELMSLCLKMADDGLDLIFDSGGPLVEIEILAKRVVNILNSSSTITRETLNTDLMPNHYHSKGSAYEENLYKYFKVEPASLDSQIAETARAL